MTFHLLFILGGLSLLLKWEALCLLTQELLRRRGKSGMAMILQEKTLLKIQKDSEMSMAMLCQPESTQPFIGTGKENTLRNSNRVNQNIDKKQMSYLCFVWTVKYIAFRHLQQWVVSYNGYDGNIYITTAKTLPNFEPPKILIARENEDQREWYPNIIHEVLGTFYTIYPYHVMFILLNSAVLSEKCWKLKISNLWDLIF